MGQKVNPTGFRTGITEEWKSKWYAPKAAYGAFLVEDFKVRKLIDAKLNRRPPFAAVSDILIERTREEVTITLKTARPGLVIGPYAKQGYVSSVQYDHTSALKHLSNAFSLEPLNPRVAAANDLSDCIDLERLARGEPADPIEIPEIDLSTFPHEDPKCHGAPSFRTSATARTRSVISHACSPT